MASFFAVQNPSITMKVAELTQRFSSHEWPKFVDIEAAANGWAISLFIDENIRWFTGHFPEQPVLAGVVQTHWAAELGKFLFPLGDNFIRIDNLKFQTVILPGQSVTLHLEYLPDSENCALKFRYVHGDIAFSEGKFVFRR